MEAERVAMFRVESRWDGWQQFDAAEHERNTREDGRYEVRDFVPVDSSLRSAIEQEVERLRERAQNPALHDNAQEEAIIAADFLRRILNEQGGGSDD